MIALVRHKRTGCAEREVAVGLELQVEREVNGSIGDYCAGCHSTEAMQTVCARHQF